MEHRDPANSDANVAVANAAAAERVAKEALSEAHRKFDTLILAQHRAQIAADDARQLKLKACAHRDAAKAALDTAEDAVCAAVATVAATAKARDSAEEVVWVARVQLEELSAMQV